MCFPKKLLPQTNPRPPTLLPHHKIQEKKMETTIVGYIGIIGYILGLYWGNGKENGNYYSG